MISDFMNQPPWHDTRDGSVVIDGLVQISSNNGIRLWDWTDFTPFAEMDRWSEVASIIAEHNGLEADRLLSALAKAIQYRRHELLAEALNHRWPGGDRGPITFERFIEIVRHVEVMRRNRAVKRQFTILRRREFDAIRAQLALRMLDAGIPYCCAHPGCGVIVDLTIDHKLALSRGGGDDLDNLQFMCLAHNAQKGDKP